MKHFILVISIFGFSLSSYSSVEALFHPYDDTMGKIASIFMDAEHTIDMALYNIDVKDSNPVIAALKSDKLQAKIKNGDLVVRIIFEGYSAKEKNFLKMEKLEAIGADARYLGSGKKMHHKFSTVDNATIWPTLITGSANWSLSSLKNYSENILFIYDQPGITNNFQSEFELLWSQSKEYGFTNDVIKIQKTDSIGFQLEEGVDVSFNTKNFIVTNKGFRKRKGPNYTLTRKIVKAIDGAKDKVEIATTRIKLRPIYNAILRAANRGVKVNIIVTMGEFKPAFIRRSKKMKSCSDPYVKSCSTSQNFAMYLNDENYNGKKNVKVRVKYFDLRHESYLQKQMHSKYMIVDRKQVLTGSFNWSYSSEYNHFENLVTLDASMHLGAINSFSNDFDSLWDLNRNKYADKIIKLKSKQKIKCNFSPMSLNAKEIDTLLNTAKKVNRSLKKVCL